jgi:hypothetical protein
VNKSLLSPTQKAGPLINPLWKNKMINDNIIKKIISNSIHDLISIDKPIFSLPMDDNSDFERKLHEVCINHRFALYLQKNISEFCSENNIENLYVDIEFNKKGSNPKKVVDDNGQKIEVRPDIIIHNRKDEREKINILVVEAKKDNISTHDIRKIKALMNDPDYKYRYGLTISYCKRNDQVNACLYRHEGNQIIEESLPPFRI